MSQDLPESDWKLFRRLQKLALERFCKRVLEELKPVARNTSCTYHERYLEVFHLLKDRDRELAQAFDDPRRSRMIQQLVAMHTLGLLEAGELEGFIATHSHNRRCPCEGGRALRDRRLTSA